MPNPIPAVHTEQITTMVEGEIADRIRALAEVRGASVSAVVRDMIMSGPLDTAVQALDGGSQERLGEVQARRARARRKRQRAGSRVAAGS